MTIDDAPDPEPIPDASPPGPKPSPPFTPTPGWNPWWYQASMWIARTAMGVLEPLRSGRRDA